MRFLHFYSYLRVASHDIVSAMNIAVTLCRCGAASIAAALSGAASVTANDVDESAAAAARDNADLNGACIGVCSRDRLRGDM